MKLQESHRHHNHNHNHNLHDETQQLLSSLMEEEIPNIQSFKGKWSLIKTKLKDFPSQLKNLIELPTSQLTSELVLSISQTLTETLSLAQKCLQPNPIDGKLRTQNDLDSVHAKLDQHIKDIDILIKSSVNEVVSDSDTIRVELKSLITRLQIGNSEWKNSAMDSLLGLLNEGDKNVLIAVGENLVPVLVNLLDSSCVEIKEKAACVISRVLVEDCCKHVLVDDGVLLINHLIRVLESRSGFAKERACVALQALSFVKENAGVIGSRGGISSLLEICQYGTPCSQVYATGVLRNLSGFIEIKPNFIEENAISVLIGVAGSGTFVAQENAIGCLSNLVLEDESLKLSLVQEGGIECLKSFWDAAPMIQSLEVAIVFLRNLATCRIVGEVLVCEGFIDKLVGVLNCGVVGIRIAAAAVVYELGFSSKIRKEMGEVGIIGQLVRMLDAKAVEEKEMAAKALSSLMLYAGNRTIFAKEEKAIEFTVHLLDPSIQKLDKRYVVSVLASIVNSKRCRKQMVATGACVHLQKLVEMDIDGVKKLSESLDRNSSTWAVFARRKQNNLR